MTFHRQKKRGCLFTLRAWYNGSCAMMAKLTKTLQLHHPMIQWLIINNYSPLATDIEMNSCFSIYSNSEIIYTTKKINFDDFFACHGRKPGGNFFPSCSERIFGVWLANQSASSTISTVLVYTNSAHSLLWQIPFQAAGIAIPAYAGKGDIAKSATSGAIRALLLSELVAQRLAECATRWANKKWAITEYSASYS